MIFVSCTPYSNYQYVEVDTKPENIVESGFFLDPISEDLGIYMLVYTGRNEEKAQEALSKWNIQASKFCSKTYKVNNLNINTLKGSHKLDTSGAMLVEGVYVQWEVPVEIKHNIATIDGVFTCADS